MRPCPHMRILNMNCRSILNKSTELEGIILAHDPSILLLTETWLNDSIFDSEFVPADFNVFRKDRGARGGGVCILFKNSLNIIRMPDVPNVEALFCKTYHGNVKYVIGVVYRPPSLEPIDLIELQNYMTIHVRQEDRVILAGDFNAPNIDWSLLTTRKQNDKVGEAIIDFVFAFDLLQIVDDFTRIQGQTRSILDLFFIRGFPAPCVTCEIHPGISDHEMVLLTLSGVSMNEHRSIRNFPNFSRADDVSIIDTLSFHFDTFASSDASVNYLWDRLKSIIMECMDRFVPRIVKKPKKRNPWITRPTLQLKRKLKRLKKKGSSTNAQKQEISLLTVKLQSEVSKDKQNYHSVLLPRFISTSPEKFWRLISPSSRSSTAFEVDGSITHDSSKIANAFNAQFQSVFTKDNNLLPDFSLSLPPVPDIVISETGILNLLLNIDIKKSCGPDDIPNEFLKRYAEWMAKYLHVLFSKSLQEGEVPLDWKIAKITPLHKNGSNSTVKNYRPISLISTACKLMEHAIHKHISVFLEEQNFFTKGQHGFRKGFSTQTQLVETIHDFATSINNGNQTDAIFLDFRKAFDTVSHNKLLYKLNLVLQNPKLISWISSYITGRLQMVSFNQHCSGRVSVSSGVPQGSVLGPLFFLIFINDIVDGIPVKIKLYADDCILYCEVKNSNDQLLLNQAFEKVMSWCESWQMCLNLEKTVAMKITRKKTPLTYYYGYKNNYLSEVTEYKYLGLLITSDLRWNKHIDQVIAHTQRKLFFLRRALKLSTPTVRLLAYKSVILPGLDYAAIIWDPYTKTNIDKLESIQKRAVRFIYNRYDRTSVTDLLTRAKLQPLSTRNRHSRLKFLYQILMGHVKVDTYSVMPLTSRYSTRLRHDRTLTPHQTRNNAFKYSFFPRTVNDWNLLTNEQVLQSSLASFTSSLCS